MRKIFECNSILIPKMCSKLKIVFLILAGLLAIVWLGGLTRCKTSWYDEAAYASRAVNFADNRGMGMAFLKQPATAADAFVVDPLLRGVWFKVFDVGIFQNRIFNIVCLLGGCLFFYMACGLLQFSLFAKLLGMFLLALDSSWVWFIRTGRPDPSALLLISISFFCITRILTNSPSLSRRLGWAILCGISIALSFICHAYSIPTGCWFIVFLFVSMRPPFSPSKEKFMILAGLAAGGLLVALGYMPYLVANGQKIVSSFDFSRRYVGQEVTRSISILTTIITELRRWLRGSLIMFPAWLLVFRTIFTGLKKNHSPRRTWIVFGGSWIAIHFISCLVLLPKHNWYPIGYAAIPFCFLAAMAMDIQSKERTKLTQVFYRWIGIGAVVWNLGLALIYPITAALQSRERSPEAAKKDFLAYLPRESTVACDFNPYLVLCECGFRPVFIYPSVIPYMNDEVFKGRYLIEVINSVDYIVLSHGDKLPDLFPNQLQYMRSVGSPKKDLKWAKDPPVWFDIYYVIAPK